MISHTIRAIGLGAIALVVVPGSIAALAAGSAKPNVHVSCTLGATSVIAWANFVTDSLHAEYSNEPYLHELDGRSGEVNAPIINVAHRGPHGRVTVTNPRRVPKNWYLGEVDLWSRTKGRGAIISLYPMRLCTRPAPPRPPVPTISVAVANNTALSVVGAPSNTPVRRGLAASGSPISVLPLQHVGAGMRRHRAGEQRLQHAQHDDLRQGASGHHGAGHRHRKHRERHIDHHQLGGRDPLQRAAELGRLHD